MDFLRQLGVGRGNAGGFINQNVSQSNQAQREYTRVPEFIKGVGETLGYSSKVAGDVMQNIGPLAAAALL